MYCAKNILARELRYQLSRVLLRYFSFHLINPRRLSRAASSVCDFQTAAWAHLPHAAPQAPPYRTGRSSRSAYSPASNDSYVIRMFFYDTYLYLFESDSLSINVCNSVSSIVAELRVYQSVSYQDDKRLSLKLSPVR